MVTLILAIIGVFLLFVGVALVLSLVFIGGQLHQILTRLELDSDKVL